jgi:acyl carrier protein
MHSTTDQSLETVTAAVRSALARVLNRSIDEIRPESRLDDDLGIDSLMMIHASIAIEEELRLAVPIRAASDGLFATVADLIAFIHGGISQEPASC